jgi:MFS family permease
LSRVSDSIAGGLTFPFLAPFALQHLRAPEEIVGVFLSLQTGASAASNLLWSHLGDNRGNRKLLVCSAVAALLPSALALASLMVPRVPLGTWLGVPFTLPLAVFTLAFIPQGFAMSGMNIGQTNYLLDLAPNRRRPTYVAFSQMLMFPLAWWPVAGALLIGHSRFALGFGVALVAAVGTLAMVVRLQEPRAADLGLEEGTDAPDSRLGEHDPAAGG